MSDFQFSELESILPACQRKVTHLSPGQIFLPEELLESLPCLLFWKNVDGAYLGGNDLWVSNTGLPDKDSSLGKTDFELPWLSAAEMLRHNDLQAIQARSLLLFEEHGITAAGFKSYWSQKRPLFNKNQELVGLLGVSVDITDQKKDIERAYISEQVLGACELEELIFRCQHKEIIIHCAQNNVCLTKREALCLLYLFTIKTSKKIAQKMGISSRTVETHIANIKVKLGCYFKADIPKIALEGEFLDNFLTF